MLELSQRSGVSTQTICLAENGVRDPYGRTINKLAKGFEVPVDELLAAELTRTPHKAQ